MTTECDNCKKSFPPEKIFECEFCNKIDDSDEDSDEEEIKEPTQMLCEWRSGSILVSFSGHLDEEEIKEPTQMLCEWCSRECFICESRGCKECVNTVCCDCSVSMCKECRNGDDLCGCYGKCYWCNRDVDRGSDGWPCDECNRWGCHDCRLGNGCKDCDPNYDSEEEVPIDQISLNNLSLNPQTKIEVEKQPNDVQSLQEKITKLESEINQLQYKNLRLTEILDARNEENAEKILDHFYAVNSIRQTAWQYGMEMDKLYELIPQWCGCYDRLHMANDFEECRIEVIGRREYDEEKEADLDSEDFENRNRKPNADETDKIMSDYKDGHMSLYKLADKYDLQINNLFIILKENKVIEKETDVKNYAIFYREYFGVGYEWDGTSDIGLLLE